MVTGRCQLDPTNDVRRAYPFACTFAQVSLSVSVRLNTSASGVESTSGVK